MAFAQAYRTVGTEIAVNGATPHRLIAMLFDGYMDALARARGALQAGQIEVKGREFGRAARIVEEGLKAALDMQAGGTLARDLCDLYNYLSARLTLANLRNDERMLEECIALMQPVREAWAAIGPDAGRTSA